MLIDNTTRDKDSEKLNDAFHNALTTMLQDQSAQVRKNTALSLMKMEAVESIEDIDNAISIETDEQVKAVMTVALNQLKRGNHCQKMGL